VGILSDVTGEVEAEDAKASFLARTSHELRTPLTIIMGLAQTLMRPGLDDEQRAKMNKTIVETATRLNGLIDRLLAASAEPAGVEPAVPVPLDLLDVVDAAAEIARERGFDVVVDVQTGVRALAPSDAVRDVLAELVGNAIKFSPGGGSISIDARQDDRAVVVGVSDWGIGMDDEQQQRCFDRFWQAESKDTRRYEGTGIGLTVARSLVEGWGGSISVRSVLGSGSRFEFTIPRAGARSKSA
jgi:signal transduction histidine kinase